MKRPLHRLKGMERRNKLTRSFMSASMFASTERPSTELAFVLFIRNVLRLRRFWHRCDRRCDSCSSRHCSAMKSSTRMPRVRRMGLSDTVASMTMDWTYAKENSFDHAFWCSSKRRRRRRKVAGDRAGVVLAASLVLWSLVGFFVCEITLRASTVGLSEGFDAIRDDI